MSWFRWSEHTLTLQLHIQPGAKQNIIVGLHGDRLKLKIHAPPVEGKANAELIDFVSQCFGTSKSGVTVIHGSLGRSKTVCITDPQQIPPDLAALGLKF